MTSLKAKIRDYPSGLEPDLKPRKAFIYLSYYTLTYLPLTSILPSQRDVGKISIGGKTIYLGENKSSIESKLGAPSEIYDDGSGTAGHFYQSIKTTLWYSASGRLVKLSSAQTGFSYTGRTVGEKYFYKGGGQLKGDERWLPGYGNWPELETYKKIVENSDGSSSMIVVQFNAKGANKAAEPDIFGGVTITLDAEDATGKTWTDPQ